MGLVSTSLLLRKSKSTQPVSTSDQWLPLPTRGVLRLGNQPSRASGACWIKQRLDWNTPACADPTHWTRVRPFLGQPGIVGGGGVVWWSKLRARRRSPSLAGAPTVRSPGGRRRHRVRSKYFSGGGSSASLAATVDAWLDFSRRSRITSLPTDHPTAGGAAAPLPAAHAALVEARQGRELGLAEPQGLRRVARSRPASP